jgi:hypothetical protein
MCNEIDSIVLNDLEMYDFFENICNNKIEFFEFLNRNNNEYISPNPLYIKKNNLYKMFKNLGILYDYYDVDEQILMIDNALKILKKIGFNDLDELLSSNYYELETITFFEYRLSDGEPTRTRDHFKHQFRNAFFGLKLLTLDDFLNGCIKSIIEEKSIISSNILNYINENQRDEELKGIIISSYFLSALFHDIGYPLAYYFRTTNSIHKYPPFFKIISGNVKSNFSDIRAILLESELFKLYDSDEIEKRYNDNDHGTLSAISFLMHYYYNGKIYNCYSKNLDSQKKKIIVDWASIAIYNHTEKYNESRPLFAEDPVSYLLRICDDLQEWGRFSILMDDNRNLLYCNECGQLLWLKDGVYTCDCDSSNNERGQQKHKGYEKINKIQNKKINYISMCENMEIKKSISTGKITIKVNYDIISQLEMILFNYSEVVYRYKEIEKAKKILINQPLLPEIEIDSFLSNNPAKLINKFLENDFSDKKFVDYREDIRKLQQACNDTSRFGKEIEIDAVKYKKIAIDFVKQNIGITYKLNKLINEKT